MQLLIVRHAIAEDVDPARPEMTDADRRLTRKGESKMRKGAAGLRELVPELGLIASSPLVRAVQTAEILSAAYDGLDVVQTHVLAPGSSSEDVAAWVTRQEVDGVVALVGHEPGLSLLATWLLCDSPRSVVELKKGAACLLNWPAGTGRGSATLLWSLRPRHLRGLR